jgi:protein-L-isoaspartate(D-aspartate) O-methyltransferase
MTQALHLQGNERVLEIGTRCGYQAAILSLLAKEIYTIERLPSLAERAQSVLRRLGYTNVSAFLGDGTKGLPAYAPFDAILVTAGGKRIPLRLEVAVRSGVCIEEFRQDLGNDTPSNLTQALPEKDKVHWLLSFCYVGTLLL